MAGRPPEPASVAAGVGALQKAQRWPETVTHPRRVRFSVKPHDRHPQDIASQPDAHPRGAPQARDPLPGGVAVAAVGVPRRDASNRTQVKFRY